MNTSIDMEKLREDAVHIFNSGFTCSESVIYAIRKNFELEMSDDAIAMSSGFPWGLGGAGCICGALAGGTMCIGYFYGRTEPGDPRNQLCFKLCNELHDFEHLHRSVAGGHDEPAIGEAGVRVEHVALAVGRQQCQQSVIVVDQQRVVAEAVGMILHVLPQKQEGPVRRLVDKIVPIAVISRRIPVYLHAHTFFVFTD